MAIPLGLDPQQFPRLVPGFGILGFGALGSGCRVWVKGFVQDFQPNWPQTFESYILYRIDLSSGKH